MAKLGVTASYAYGADAAGIKAEQQGSWIGNGLIDAGGSHEPYLSSCVAAIKSLNAREIYEREQSEEVIQQLERQGVEVFHTHLSVRDFRHESKAKEMKTPYGTRP